MYFTKYIDSFVLTHLKILIFADKSGKINSRRRGRYSSKPSDTRERKKYKGFLSSGVSD